MRMQKKSYPLARPRLHKTRSSYDYTFLSLFSIVVPLSIPFFKFLLGIPCRTPLHGGSITRWDIPGRELHQDFWQSPPPTLFFVPLYEFSSLLFLFFSVCFVLFLKLFSFLRVDVLSPAVVFIFPFTSILCLTLSIWEFFYFLQIVCQEHRIFLLNLSSAVELSQGERVFLLPQSRT